MRLSKSMLLLAACGLSLLTPAWPAAAQSTGYVTGLLDVSFQKVVHPV